MNKRINTLKMALNKVTDELQLIQYNIQHEYNVIFKEDVDIKRELATLEASEALVWSEAGDIAKKSEITSALTFKYENVLPELFNYLQDEHFVTLSVKSNTLTTPLGPCIIFNPEGDVYDQESGKVIIEEKEYSTEQGYDHNKLVTLIKSWMTNAGYFPAVIVANGSGWLNFLHMSLVSEKDNELYKKGQE